MQRCSTQRRASALIMPSMVTANLSPSQKIWSIMLPEWKFAWPILSPPLPHCECSGGGQYRGIYWTDWMTGCFPVNVFSMQAPDSGQKRRSSPEVILPLPIFRSIRPPISTPTSLFIPCHYHNTSHLCDAELETCNFQKVSLLRVVTWTWFLSNACSSWSPQCMKQDNVSVATVKRRCSLHTRK